MSLSINYVFRDVIYNRYFHTHFTYLNIRSLSLDTFDGIRLSSYIIFLNTNKGSLVPVLPVVMSTSDLRLEF